MMGLHVHAFIRQRHLPDPWMMETLEATVVVADVVLGPTGAELI